MQPQAISTARDVSDYIVYKCYKHKINLSVTKLQQYLFGVQGWTLAVYGKKAFPEKIFVTDIGVLERSTYGRFKHFSNKKFTPIVLVKRELDSRVKGIVKKIILYFGNCSAKDMFSENKNPWIRDMCRKYNCNHIIRPTLSCSYMKDYFSYYLGVKLRIYLGLMTLTHKYIINEFPDIARILNFDKNIKLFQHNVLAKKKNSTENDKKSSGDGVTVIVEKRKDLDPIRKEKIKFMGDSANNRFNSDRTYWMNTNKPKEPRRAEAGKRPRPRIDYISRSGLRVCVSKSRTDTVVANNFKKGTKRVLRKVKVDENIPCKKTKVTKNNEIRPRVIDHTPKETVETLCEITRLKKQLDIAKHRDFIDRRAICKTRSASTKARLKKAEEKLIAELFPSEGNSQK